MHTLVSDASAALESAPRTSLLDTSRLVPSWFKRWYVRHALSRGEVYLFDLLSNVRHRSVIGDVIQSATTRPTVESFRRITAHLASQCNDSPRVMAEIVGEELVLMLKAQGAIYRIDQTFTGMAKVDLRHLSGGARFRINLHDQHIYVVIESGPRVVMYMRDGLTDAIVRAYPKEEGPVDVYLEPTTATV